MSDFSFDRKSPPFIWETWVLESELHAPILCGCFLVWAFTESGARRSELPSRNTGLTALPLTLS